LNPKASKFCPKSKRGNLVRLLRILGVLVVIGFAALALGMALRDPANHSHAQNQIEIQTSTAAPAAQSASAAATSTARPVSSSGVPATVVASNVGVRTLAVAPQSSEAVIGSDPATLSTQLYLTAIDRPDQVFSYSVRAVPNIVPANAAKLFAVPAAGAGTVGSIGDGGVASAAELDLWLNGFTMRSEVAVAPDGTFFIADTGNATIRTVAGAATSEPAIIRSVAGRWAPRQNVELIEPYGVTLDRSGNLFIADHGANAVVELFGAASPKAGQLEILAHMISPAAVAVAPDGNTVFAASPDTGVIVAINAQTHALRSANVSPAPLLATASAPSNGARIIPQGLAVDGGGNLFIAYTSEGGHSDEILRLDALSSKLTVAARGLSAPGNISFNAEGDLFVANQGMRQLLDFKSMGAPTTGVTLLPPTPCTSAPTVFCDQVTGGTSPTLPYELFNNNSSAITGISASFTAGNTSDFTVSNSSCTTSLAANSSCAYNVAFTPAANATSACPGGGAPNTRCATFTVNYTGATAPLAAEASGVADDFEISCMTTSIFTCPPPSNGAPYQITIEQGFPATFQLQIVPDNTFSGSVTLNCPTNLPSAPAGSAGNPTVCGISAGTTVSLPLANTITLPVVAGTAVPFNVTFQTTTTAGKQFPAPAASPARRLGALAGLFSSRFGGSGNSGSSGSAQGPWARGLAAAFLLVIMCLLLVWLVRRSRSPRMVPALAFTFVLAICATVAGCHHYNSTANIIPYTPTGTYTLTVHGFVQNASRGFTMTLVVDN
jgi:sugar lactone lactonase YvrE